MGNLPGLKIVQVDAFTNRPFSGNAAAVIVLREPRGTEWMQRLAQETNLAATVYLWLIEGENYGVRWFTPASELPLCGHGTLAAAHVLWTEGYVCSGRCIEFQAPRHRLTATREDGWITLDFPAIFNAPCEAPDALLRGLGVGVRFVGKSHHSYLVELGSEAEVRALAPDIALLASLDIANVIETSQVEEGEYDFLSRFFAPSHGIAEDPVTGSAHCSLGPFWSERLGKSRMVGYQASSRGGTVRVFVQGDRVALGGQAVTVARGELSEAAEGWE